MTDTDAITTLALFSLGLMVCMAVCAVLAAVGAIDAISGWLGEETE